MLRDSVGAIELRDVRRLFRTTTGTLRRHAKEIVALDGLSLEVGEGELFGILGPNGAGKTTTIKVLTTLLIPTSGTATVMGLDVVRDAKEVRRRIGFVFGGERGLYYRLSGRDNLRYFGELYAVPPREIASRVEELLALVDLRDRGDERVEGYSRGMKQRLHLARTLLHRPRVLWLDAPTIERLRALDFVDSVVVEQRELRQVLRIQTRLAERAVAPLIAAVAAGQVGRVAVREATLEDAYVRLVGRVE